MFGIDSLLEDRDRDIDDGSFDGVSQYMDVADSSYENDAQEIRIFCGDESSSCTSVVDSTNDGILTPTCPSDENHSEAAYPPVSFDTGVRRKISRSWEKINRPDSLGSQNSTAHFGIEQEINRRVHAELLVRELAVLRREKQEWLRKGEIKLANWLRKFEEEKEATRTIEKELESFKAAYMQRQAVEQALATLKAPIRFKDAVGRKFSFPFHSAATWNGISELIKQAFLHVDVLGPHVNDGHFDLICSSGRSTGEYILPQAWEAMVEPGWQVTMHMWPLPGMPQHVGRNVDSTIPPPPPPPPPPSPLQSQSTHPDEMWPRTGGNPARSPPPPDSRPAIDVEKKLIQEHRAYIQSSTSLPPRSRSSGISSTNSKSPNEDKAITLLKSMIHTKRIFVVGKVGRARRTVIQVQVRPKQEGTRVLNAYGRLFVSEMRRLKDIGSSGGDEEVSKEPEMDGDEAGIIYTEFGKMKGWGFDES
ncbi:uncharacterized protein RAG0_14595 [Rhynchosporium agropyri]|uniref:Ubiquitin-like domain-containing protein n=1 Tax=Rhynchosporium agropyri TaxID=914238 RepID=A0A1E1LHJ5_9HELO|nr:uncharacterized protein RAG0_14595 [Rhynchosporium agropyri]